MKLAAILAVAAIVAGLSGGAGAASSPAGPTKAGSGPVARATSSTAAARRASLLRHANLETVAGVQRYLRAIGVSPKGVVIQRGGRNYAGPTCPGGGWKCTSTAHPVVQIGAKNTFLCTTGSCAVVQVTRTAKARAATAGRSLTAAAAADNLAKCIKTTGLTQSCTISQTSATVPNRAIVYMNTSKMSGLTQTASYTAQITQQATGASNGNTACLYQNINIDGSTVGKKAAAVAVTLNAHESASVTQNAHGGNNSVQSASSTDCASGPLSQLQTLTSTASGSASITQNQNAADSGPNVSLDIEQNQGAGFLNDASTTGANTAPFTQSSTLTAIAGTPAGPVTQTQSAQSGGIQAKVNQFSHGLSTVTANQTESQCEDAEGSSGPLTCPDTPQGTPQYTPKQTQFGPVANTGARLPMAGRSLAKVGKGPCPPTCSTQTGNSGDMFTINQSSTQNNDTGHDQTNLISGDCATAGTCTVTQSTNIDGVQSSNTQSGSTVNTQTDCSGSSCTSSGPTGGTLTLLPNGLSMSNTDVGDFGYQSAGFVVWVSAADPSGDDERFCGPAVGVDVLGGQLVEHHVDVGARHVVDLGVDACHFRGQLRLGVGAQRRRQGGAGVYRHGSSSRG
jgi:hypothetical protein